MSRLVLIPELTINGRVYRDVGTDGGAGNWSLTTSRWNRNVNLPFFDSQGPYIGNLMEIHTELPEFHLSLALSIFGFTNSAKPIPGSRPTSSIEETIEGLVSRGFVSRTSYGYMPERGLHTPLLRAEGEFFSHVQSALQERARPTDG